MAWIMKAQMIGASHKLKILRAIVKTVAVLMMDYLLVCKRSPEQLGHDDTVFKDSVTVKGYKLVAMPDCAGTFLSCLPNAMCSSPASKGHSMVGAQCRVAHRIRFKSA